MGTTAGAVGSFLLTRSSLRPVFMRWLRRYEHKWSSLNNALQKEGPLLVTILLRLSPVLPVTPASYILALTDIGLGPFTLGTVLGMLC